MPCKREWRVQLRAKRRALSRTRQGINARLLSQFLFQLPLMKPMRSVAVYWPNDGEIDPRVFMHQACAAGIRVYLPVITQQGAMLFAEYQRNKPLVRNRYGIPEPKGSGIAWKEAWQMDVILLPLVGFDRQGNRLGMGGGFYDRALAQHADRIKKPEYWGLAHQCQQVEALPIDAWDVPLKGVVTERGIVRFTYR